MSLKLDEEGKIIWKNFLFDVGVTTTIVIIIYSTAYLLRV